jgi:hypothetical protein
LLQDGDILYCRDFHSVRSNPASLFFKSSKLRNEFCFAADKAEKEGNQVVPTFVTPLKNQTVDAGQTLTLRVRASGNPTPTLKWFRAEHEISLTEKRISMLDDGHGGSVLTIRKVELEDAHLYRCVAANAAGEASTEGTVAVEGFFSDKISDEFWTD